MYFDEKILTDYGVQNSEFYQFVIAYQDSLIWISYCLEESIKCLGILFNVLILLTMLLHWIFSKQTLLCKEDASVPTYLQTNTSALILVLNLCIIDLMSVIILFILVPKILSENFSSADSCAVKVTAFCFINLGTTLSTFFLTLERWIKIAHFEKHGRIFSRCTVSALVTSVWVSTLLFCASAYYFVSLETTSSAWLCRTSSLSATPLLLTKPCLVLIMSTAMFVLYGDIIVKFWTMKSRREERKRKQTMNCQGEIVPNILPRKKLFKGIAPESIYEKDPPVRLTDFKICNHSSCKIQPSNFCFTEAGPLSSETKIRKIFRYLKDSKYVICILAVYFCSWVPWILTFFIDFLLVQSNYYDEKATQFCGNFSVKNSENLVLQIQDILKENVVTSLANITLDATGNSTVCRALSKVFEDATFDILTRLHVVSGAASCVADPLIYALWYKPVRKQVADIVTSVKSIFTSRTRMR